MSDAEFNKKFLEFAKPFIDSLRGIYQTMMATEISAQKPSIKEAGVPVGDYSSIMGISGQVEMEGGKQKFMGSLVISWPEKTYLATASKMLGCEFTKIEEDIADLGMEICNMTMGGAKSVLVENGFHIEMSIPTAIRGPDHILKVEDGVVTVVTPFDSDLGKLAVEVNFKLV